MTPESLEWLNKIRIVECGEPLVDVREIAPDLLLRPKIPPYVRESVAKKLAIISKELLKTPYRLHLHRGYRSIAEQKAHWDERYEELKGLHPEWTENILARETNKAIAPYNQPTPPGHATGAAVDVYLVTPDGKPLDLVPPVMDWRITCTDCQKVSKEQQELRTLLCEVMTAQGFSNYPFEYWHYSFGDSAWAARNNLGECKYGFISLPSHRQEP